MIISERASDRHTTGKSEPVESAFDIVPIGLPESKRSSSGPAEIVEPFLRTARRTGRPSRRVPFELSESMRTKVPSSSRTSK